jgi:RNA polymerase sigma-70 factor (ECF subfamily)
MSKQVKTMGAVLEIVKNPSEQPAPAPDFTVIFREHSSYVWSTLRRLGVRERDLEDLVHDVFIVVHRHLPDFDARRPLRPWLFGIAFRVASGYRRLGRTQNELVSDDLEGTSSTPSADDLLQAKQEQTLVLRALEAMDLDKRGILVMHDFDGHAMPEIARVFEVPLNTAYSRLRLARAQFVNNCRAIQARKGGPR